jgi:hypothetical protein
MVCSRSKSAFDARLNRPECPLKFVRLTQNRIIKTHESVSNGYFMYYKTGNPQLRTFSVPLYAFTLDQNAPRFMRDPEGRSHGFNIHHLPGLRSGFMEVCDLSADLSGMSGGLERRWGAAGAFWVLNFSIGIEFGGVELQAYVEWVEKVGRALVPRNARI